MDLSTLWHALLDVGAIGGAASIVSSLLKRRSTPRAAITMAAVADLAQRVVLAVEQTHGAQDGTAKRALAESMISDVLSHFGLRLPQALIDACLESAVRLMRAATTTTKTPPSDGGAA